jgi:NarL family two-component system response regulator LiaR
MGWVINLHLIFVLMLKTIIIYGVTLATLVLLLKVVEYRYFVHDLSLEFYLGLVAVLFTALGIWAGLKLTRKKTVLINPDFHLNQTELKRLGISARELEVLQLMASGLSNQEIADKLFVSLNTIKTHTSSIFSKLDAKRRTQAIQRAKELLFIP